MIDIRTDEFLANMLNGRSPTDAGALAGGEAYSAPSEEAIACVESLLKCLDPSYREAVRSFFGLDGQDPQNGLHGAELIGKALSQLRKLSAPQSALLGAN